MGPVESAYANASSSIFKSDSGQGLGIRGVRKNEKGTVILNPVLAYYYLLNTSDSTRTSKAH